MHMDRNILDKLKWEEYSYFYKATCLVKLILNLAAFSNFNYLHRNSELDLKARNIFEIQHMILYILRRYTLHQA
jgi:hypothetical protein